MNLEPICMPDVYSSNVWFGEDRLPWWLETGVFYTYFEGPELETGVAVRNTTLSAVYAIRRSS